MDFHDFEGNNSLIAWLVSEVIDDRFDISSNLLRVDSFGGEVETSERSELILDRFEENKESRSSAFFKDGMPNLPIFLWCLEFWGNSTGR
jgi:hypothetical protein